MPVNIKVWLFGPQPLFRLGLRQALSQTDDIEVIGESGPQEKKLLGLELTPPDVIIIDIDLGAPRDLALLRRIKEVAPAVPIIALATSLRSELPAEAVQAWVSVYTAKSINSGEICQLVRRLASRVGRTGGPAAELPAESQERAPEYPANTPSPLSSREIEITNLMAAGCANKQIALQLGISEQTVKNHITSIFDKLGATARTDAVMKALRSGLINLSVKD